MKRTLLLLIILQIYRSLPGSVGDPLRVKTANSDDPGEPLFLTPYVESGRVEEGRRLARVPLADHLGVTSYAGFFTVNKTYNSNQFFWYFPPTEADPKTAPVVLWLQGGPGGSSMFGLFAENGPIQVVNYTIMNRKYHWAKNHHLLYVDNPVGTGFSFTENKEGYCMDEIRVGAELYSTVLQFLQLFPELQQSRLFVTGESYAGKYAPALAYTIHVRNPHASLKVNLKGLAIGDGLSDPIHQIDYGKYLYQIGLIDWNQLNEFENDMKKAENYIKEKDWANAMDNVGKMLDLYAMYTGLNEYNFLQTSTRGGNQANDYVPMLKKNDVRKQIHVGNLSFDEFNSEVQEHLANDMMQSVAPWISELLDHYKILIYNGQLDVIVGYSLTRNYLRHLNFSGAAEYKTASRRIWMVDEEVAGYVKRAGRLVEVLVRNSGHMVPADQPRWAQDLITRFTHDQPFDSVAGSF